jgi:hypothetical protein
LAPTKAGKLLPFTGELAFISDLLLKRRDRSKGLTLSEGRALAQIGSVVRALPYPSKTQVVESVKDTIGIIQNPGPKLRNRILKEHKRSLESYIRKFKPDDKKLTTHMSLTNSASNEATRDEGGKASYLVKLGHKACDQLLSHDDLDFLSGRVDCFGNEIVKPVVAEFAKRLMDLNEEDPAYEKSISLGEVLYVTSLELVQNLKDKKKGNNVPRKLGMIILNISCLDMTKFGWYDNNPETVYDVLSFEQTFKGKLSRFHMTKEAIPVRASLSLEAGMKTLLVTSAPAAVTQLGQLLGNKAREYLSKDLFVRIGFQESDKLWEVLSQYDKKFSRR